MAVFVENVNEKIYKLKLIIRRYGSEFFTTMLIITQITMFLIFFAMLLLTFEREHSANVIYDEKKLPKTLKNYTDYEETIFDLFVDGFTDETRLCLDNRIQVFIIIFSKPENLKRRIEIRMTWGQHVKYTEKIGIAFILGKTNDEKLRTMIEAEQQMFSDIVLCNNVDTYKNLSLKSTCMLQWISNICYYVPWIMKCDDDVFVNVPELLLYATRLDVKDRFIYGYQGDQAVEFNKSFTYAVNKKEYKYKQYPRYITGPSYLFPAHLSKEMFSEVLNLKFFKLEDVLITGILAYNLKIAVVHNPRFVNVKAWSPYFIRFAITWHEYKMNHAWNHTLRTRTPEYHRYHYKIQLYPRPHSELYNVFLWSAKKHELSNKVFTTNIDLPASQCSFKFNHNYSLVDIQAYVRTNDLKQTTCNVYYVYHVVKKRENVKKHYSK